MKNLNEAFGLDNIPDELKMDQMKQNHADNFNGMDETDRSISVIVTLAVQFHEKMCALVCAYADIEKELGNNGEKYVGGKEALTAIMCAAYALPHGMNEDDKREALLDLTMATRAAMVLGPTTIKAIDALREGDLRPGGTVTKNGMIFYSLPKAKKS